MDIIDLAQARQQEIIEHSLAARRAPPRGASHCEDRDCGEPISPARQAMGATLCVECQNVCEQRARQWAPRAHG